MNNDLAQFSEERLKLLELRVNYPTWDDISALARIALAAKQAKPEYHIVRLELNDAWGSETVLNAYESQLDASKCKDDHGGVIIPCYTTPQPAHTEVNSPVIPDGWVIAPKHVTSTMAEAGKLLDKRLNLWKCQDIYQAMLRAAPKPESE